MKFSCEKEILLGLLGTASRAVTGKSSMPLLEGLLICADASTLTVTGYDMSMGIRTTTETDVVEPGSIVINAKLLLDIVRKLPNDVVYIETDDKLMQQHGMELLGVVEYLPERVRLGRPAWPKCYEVIGDGSAEKGKAVMDIVLAKK